ncbi:MAG: hypothetical protein JNL98_24445 [Bryobacterales bacterium]|nr:hypothetical protein [Bryobacterales bacterium]
MKVRIAALLVLIALMATLAAQTASAPTTDPKTTQALLRGQQISEAVATVTSTAISPLLGVCVLGAYEYFRTEKTQRHTLPGYTSPWFWIPVAILLLLILGKDTIGGAAPLLKKPLDAVEVLMLNKASLFLIGFPVVFHEAAKLMGVDSLLKLIAALEPVVHAQDAASVVERAGNVSMAMLLVAGGSIILVVVWMVGHAIDVLVLLSPFPVVDVLLKLVRTAIFAAVAGFALLDPRIGALLSAFVILTCMLLFGWAFRLMVFGAAFSWDLLRTMVFGSYAVPRNDAIRGFTARRMEGIAKRSYGTLRRCETGALEFTHRAFLIGPRKTITLDPSKGYEIGRGLFYPALVETSERSTSHRTILRLMPRYRKSEEVLAQILAVKGVRDVRLGSGLRAFWRWLMDDSAAVPESVAQGTAA